MGSYTKHFWVSDVTGMNKAERMGGAYYAYTPDMLCDKDILLEPTCAP